MPVAHRMAPSRRLRLALAACCLAVGLAACAEPVHHDLSERAANEVVVVLARHDIIASKQPASDGRWTVTVPGTQVQRALETLAAAGLPRRDSDVAALLSDSGSLVPSLEDERARRLIALQADIEGTFLAMDGVVDARVHAVLPTTEDAAPRAAVLLVTRADAAPPDDLAVRAIVTGAIDGLSPDAVAIVRSVTEVPPPRERVLAPLGPFAVEDSSRRGLLAILGGLVATIALLLAALARTALTSRARADDA
ncbi:MAG: hypothetical protein R3F65_31820 [bacterium]